MLRYGIPSYRFPRELLDAEIASILSLGIKVHTEVEVGNDISFQELKKQYDCLYISIGAHTDKRTGIPGEDSQGVISAVELLRQIGDGDLPDFHGKQVVVIGGGAGWYFKIYRPKKQQATDAAEDYGDDYDDTPPWEDEDETESEDEA